MTYPVWYDGKKVNETLFAREFLAEHPMKCVDGRFFTVRGRVDDEKRIRRAVFRKLSPFVPSGINHMVTELMEVLRMESAVSDLPLYTDRIHVQNGTLFLDGRFTEEAEFCRNRMSVAYAPDAPAPEKWLAFLGELLEEEDILTLQEFMGYCLIPSNRAQKMLLIIGKGGEGKSRIGLVLRALLGANMNVGSIPKVEMNRFAKADLEHKLLMVDDDIRLEALKEASNIKSIVTAEQPMDLERKGQQSYQGTLYCRFLVLGNGTIKATNDVSLAFYRRQIILKTKDKDPWREDDPYLIDKLILEKEGILLWCLEGLKRLIANDYRFTVSEKAVKNLEEAEAEGCNLPGFILSEGYIVLKDGVQSTTRQLYETYLSWCGDNALEPMARRNFCLALKDMAPQLGLNYSNNISIGCGRTARGFQNVGIAD